MYFGFFFVAFIRGRSLSNVIFIVDEAQNLTPHEVKTIITRAGENTKIIFTGDIHQIDTPYLDDMSNGMSYIIDKLKDKLTTEQITKLRKTLEIADLVKFAKAKPPLEINQEFMDDAVQFVRETKYIPLLNRNKE